MTDSELFGRRLRAARKAAGAKQGELAKALDVDPKHISRLERGKVKPSFDLICDAGRFLKVSFVDLDNADENPSVLRRRILQYVDAADAALLQKMFRILKALTTP